MKNKKNSISQKAGLPPGSLIHIGKQKAENVRISIIDYDLFNLTEKTLESPEECIPFIEKDTVSWINIDGLHDTETISTIGKIFNLHPLLLEDVLNTSHRPKVEEFDDYIFLSLKMLDLDKDKNTITSEQVSLILGKNWLLSFQEQEGDIFNALRERIRTKKGNMREKKNDYLLYRLIDTVVDNYFFITEHISEETEILEEKVLLSTDSQLLQEIQNLKKQLIKAKKYINPLREVISYIQKDPNILISEGTTRYLNDVYEHIIQLNENIETQRDTIANIMDLYHSGLSNKMNQVMQVLTIIATIFIPLTFIAGIYGMNFDNIPELHWKYGYFIILGIMIGVIIIMIMYFKKKKWL